MIENKLDEDQQVKLKSYKEELRRLEVGKRDGFISAIEDPLIRCALIVEWNKMLKENEDG